MNKPIIRPNKQWFRQTSFNLHLIFVHNYKQELLHEKKKKMNIYIGIKKKKEIMQEKRIMLS